MMDLLHIPFSLIRRMLKFLAAPISKILRAAGRTTEERRKLVEESRRMVMRYVNGPQDQTFRQYAECQLDFHRLEPYLSQDYKSKLFAPRTIYVTTEGGSLDVLADGMLKELAVLERKWSVGP